MYGIANCDTIKNEVNLFKIQTHLEVPQIASPFYPRTTSVLKAGHHCCDNLLQFPVLVFFSLKPTAILGSFFW